MIEIRGFFTDWHEVSKEQAREYISDLDCKGKEFGYCPEHESCGKYEGR